MAFMSRTSLAADACAEEADEPPHAATVVTKSAAANERRLDLLLMA